MGTSWARIRTNEIYSVFQMKVVKKKTKSDSRLTEKLEHLIQKEHREIGGLFEKEKCEQSEKNKIWVQGKIIDTAEGVR